MLDIAIVLGSTRPNRNGEAVARWVDEQAKRRRDARFELVDVADYGLPLLDEPVPPSQGLATVFDQVLRWGDALRAVREGRAATAGARA
jgi:NAD(P)H-dependent FMN reductase